MAEESRPQRPPFFEPTEPVADAPDETRRTKLLYAPWTRDIGNESAAEAPPRPVEAPTALVPSRRGTMAPAPFLRALDDPRRDEAITVQRRALPSPADPRLALLRGDLASRAGTFRVLRNRVVERPGARCVLVTSAGNGEGKTTCAANLALALAESGRDRVLLVDANVGRPGIAALFGLRPEICALDQICDAPGDPRFTPVELTPLGLHVLAIDPEGKKSRVLPGGALRTAIATLRRSYDHIIIDGPALLTSADVPVIEDAVDAVLVVASAHKAKARVVRKATEQISSAKLVGVVLMDT